jgi:hypothetical protein
MQSSRENRFNLRAKFSLDLVDLGLPQEHWDSVVAEEVSVFID